jgi:hypothetical protein
LNGLIKTSKQAKAVMLIIIKLITILQMLGGALLHDYYFTNRKMLFI